MTELDEKRLKELLEKASDIPDVSEDPIYDINLFRILGMENKEVTAHSAFLFYIFKPFYKRDKTVDDENLKVLYDILKSEIEGNQGIDIDDNTDSSDLEYIELFREVAFSDGRLDFLITYENKKGEANALVIELKIWAGEQTNQIKRYEKYLENNGYQKGKVLFLTLLGNDPTTGNAIKLTFENSINIALKTIKEKRNNKQYSTIIDQYVDIINTLSSKGENKEMEKQLAIINSAETIKAADKLFDARTTALSQVLISFISELKEWLCCKLNEKVEKSNRFNSFTLMEEYCNEDYLKNYYIDRSACTPIIVIKFPKEYLKDDIKNSLDKTNTDYYPCFYIAIEDNLFVSLTIKTNGLNYVDIKSSQEIFKRLLSEKGFNSNNVTKYHINWRYVKYNSRYINFRMYDEPRDGVLRLLEDETLLINKVAMANIKNDIFGTLKEYFEAFFEVTIE